MKREYGSLQRMKELHGIRYVKVFNLSRRVYKDKGKYYVLLNGKRFHL